jgi:hypothetical protein
MLAAVEPLTMMRGAQLGASVGLASLLFSYLLNALLRGEQKLPSVP